MSDYKKELRHLSWKLHNRIRRYERELEELDKKLEEIDNIAIELRNTIECIEEQDNE